MISVVVTSPYPTGSTKSSSTLDCFLMHQFNDRDARIMIRAEMIFKGEESSLERADCSS